MVVTDFFSPKGELEQALFPAGDGTARVTEYLQQAQDRCVTIPLENRDEATIAFCYYLAWRQVVILLNMEPAEFSADSGKTTRKYGDEQIQRFERNRDNWLAAFEVLDPGVDTIPRKPQSREVNLRPSW